MPGSTRSFEMARRMVEAGHQVHIITSDRLRSGRPYLTTEAGIQITWIPVKYSNHLNPWARIRSFLRFAIRSGYLAAHIDADIVFATSTPLTIALPAVFTKRRRRIPMVFEVRDLWPEIPIQMGYLNNSLLQLSAKKLETFAYRNATHIVTASPGMTQGVISSGIPQERVSTIPNSCDFDRFDIGPELGESFRARHDWLGSRPLVVYTGTLGTVNGVGYLVHVAAHAWSIDPSVRFLVVGSGKEESRIRSLASKLGILNKNFFMMPMVAKDKMPSILSAASFTTSTVIDVPALWHNSANKFFDSLAASRPIAINHEGWLADLIREYQAGIVLSPTDHQKAAETLIKALHDIQWMASSGKRAYALGKAQFSRDHLARELIDILESVSGTAS